jgi:aspartate/glutamate racemase
MNPTLGILVGVFGGVSFLSTLAVYAALVAAKRADEQAARVAYPVRSQLRRVRRGSRTYRSLRN